MKKIILFIFILFLLALLSSCGEDMNHDVNWIMIIEDLYKEHGMAIDENGYKYPPQDAMGQIITDVELVSYPDRIVYIQGIDTKVAWEGCKAKQTAVRPERELIYNYFALERHLENVIDYNEPGVQLIHVRMDSLTNPYRETRIDPSNPFYSKDIIIPIQIISENFYNEVKDSLLNKEREDDIYLTENKFDIYAQTIKNISIVSYPSRIVYIRGLDTKLVWDGCVVEITTENETFTKSFYETNLINIIETEVDFDEPGVYPVYIRGEGYEMSFAVQVITEDFYRVTKESLQ